MYKTMQKLFLLTYIYFRALLLFFFPASTVLNKMYSEFWTWKNEICK